MHFWVIESPICTACAGELSSSCTLENVARASSVALAHRALWGSASHRLNLLSGDYTQVGLGLARLQHPDPGQPRHFDHQRLDSADRPFRANLADRG